MSCVRIMKFAVGVVLAGAAGPASANIFGGSVRTPADNWIAQQFWNHSAAKTFSFSGDSVGDKTGGYSKSVVQNNSTSPQPPSDQQRGRSAQRGFRVLAPQFQELSAHRGSVTDLGGGERPVTPAPGVFVNFMPNPGDFGPDDGGNGTTVPVPPAVLLGAVGLGITAVARRLRNPIQRAAVG